MSGPIPVPMPLAKKNNPKPNAAPYPVISAPARTKNTPANPAPPIFQDDFANIIRSKPYLHRYDSIQS